MSNRREIVRALAVAMSIACTVAACKRASRDGGEEEPAQSSMLPGEAAPSARRPTRRYFLARTAERCQIYSLDGEVLSTPEPTPCPTDLEVGERIRIAGKTCIREGTQDPARAVPVVCPDPLSYAERRDREGR